MRFFVLVGIALFFSLPTADAQDLHFSQFYHNPMHLSPASTGVFRGDLRAAAMYRSQWTSVPVSYQTFSGAFDWKALRRNNNLVAFGMLLQHDKAGDAALTWTQIGGTASVAHAVGASQALSVGFGIAFAQRSFDISGLKFKNQWGGDYFDPTLPTKETFGSRSGLFPTFSAGVNWLYEPMDSRTRIMAGLGAFHLNRPIAGFSDDKSSRLPVRIALNINATKQLTESLDIVVLSSWQQMKTAREIIVGAGVRSILARNEMEAETAVQFTFSSRLGDALIPAVQVERGSWTVGLSYDWNTSAFEAATNNRGGIELAVVYRTLPVPPPKLKKACPIF
jgi:type IX secretion system PorP/SprF family membrane protein